MIRSRDGSLEGRTYRSPWTVIGAGAVLILAGWLDFAAGRRGLFPFDQSILFDAGHRILAGQVPFRDFVLPFGPVAPALQGSLLALLGTDWQGYLLSAALGNVAATGLGILLLRRLLPDRPGLWLLGGLLTAIWFYPPSGTPWFDQYAFLFILAGGLLLLPAALGDRRHPSVVSASWASGACWALALLTKQNAGLAGIPLFLLLLAVPLVRSTHSGAGESRRRWVPVLAWSLGVGVVVLAFALWLILAADASLFLRHGVEIPAAEGARRLREDPLGLLAVHALGTGSVEARIVVAVSALAAIGAASTALLRARGGGSAPDARLMTGGALGAGLFLAQHLFVVSSSNQAQISACFAGLLLPLGAGMVLRLGSRFGEPPGWRPSSGVSRPFSRDPRPAGGQ